MQIIKLSATPSTNSFLKEYVRQNDYTRELAVVAKQQTAGRGQMGNTWASQAGKSLVCSLFKRIEGLDLSQQFYVAMAVSLAVKKVVEDCQVPQVSVKWPNDILSGHYKLAGILIENCMHNGRWEGSVIGIGLNVNEADLPNLPRATSLKTQTGRDFDLDKLLDKLIVQIDDNLKLLQAGRRQEVKSRYETQLYQSGSVHAYTTPEGGEPFNGIIQGITENGSLRLSLEDEQEQTFGMKEIVFL